MLGQAPSTIITDDNKAMARAISHVLPNSTHQLCMWHLQKVPEHLAIVYYNTLIFKENFTNAFMTLSQLKNLKWHEMN